MWNNSVRSNLSAAGAACEGSLARRFQDPQNGSEFHVEHIPLALGTPRGQDQVVNWTPWLSVSIKSLISSTGYWLCVLAIAGLPVTWGAFSPWVITAAMENELRSVAALLGSTWGVHHAASLKGVWSLGPSEVRYLAPVFLVLLPAGILDLCALLALSPSGAAIWMPWLIGLPSLLAMALMARCLLQLPGRADVLAFGWISMGWLMASFLRGSNWVTGFGGPNSRLRQLDDSETAITYAQESLLPILGWAMLSWAICARDFARSGETLQASSAGHPPQ